MAELKALGVTAPEIITDNGHYSEKNITELLHPHFNFITLAKPSLTWIRKELQEHCEALEDFDNICQFDIDVYGYTLTLKRSFSYTGKQKSNKKGKEAGSEEAFERRIYLHLYRDSKLRHDRNRELDYQLLELKREIENSPVPEKSLKLEVRTYWNA